MIPKDKDYDRRIFRLLAILNKLDAGQKISTLQLAGDFNVSLRSIQRDLSLLSTAGFLISSPEKGRHKFEDGFSLKKMKLSNEEASLLTFLCDISRSLGGKFEDSFRKILKKAIQQEYDSPFYAKIPEGVKLDTTLPCIPELEEAIENNQKVKLTYAANDKQKTYTLNPLKIIFYDGFWYLLSKAAEKEWVLKFRLEKIREVELLEEYFDPPKNLKAMLEESVNIWFSEKRDQKVVLKVDKTVADYFRSRQYFPLQKITKIEKDGALVIETRINRYEEILAIIMHWIPYIVVISPVGLKQKITCIVKEYLEKI